MPADPIYLDYDRAALGLQYDNQLRVSDFADHVARWQKERARARRAAGRVRRGLRPVDPRR